MVRRVKPGAIGNEERTVGFICYSKMTQFFRPELPLGAVVRIKLDIPHRGRSVRRLAHIAAALMLGERDTCDLRRG
jgi:hypothetical protein